LVQSGLKLKNVSAYESEIVFRHGRVDARVTISIRMPSLGWLEPLFPERRERLQPLVDDLED